MRGVRPLMMEYSYFLGHSLSAPREVESQASWSVGTWVEKDGLGKAIVFPDLFYVAFFDGEQGFAGSVSFDGFDFGKLCAPSQLMFLDEAPKVNLAYYVVVAKVTKVVHLVVDE